MLSNVHPPPIFHLLPLPTMVIQVDNDVLTIKDINPAYVAILDCRESEVKGKLLQEVFENPSLPSPNHILSSVSKVMNSGKKDKYNELPEYLGNGQENWVWQVEHIPQDSNGGYLEIIQTLQRQQREETWPDLTDLPKTTGNPFSLWEEGLNLSKTGTWELDLNSKKLFWSPTVKEIHGVSITYQPELNSAVHFYKEGISRRVITKALELARENGQPFDVELQIITANGKQKWIRATGRAELQNGMVNRIYGAYKDLGSKNSAFEMKISIKNNKGENIPIQDRVTVIKKKNQTFSRGLITLWD